MKKIFICLSLAIFTSCTPENARTEVVVGEKVYLKDFPDSLYMANLDSNAGTVVDYSIPETANVAIGLNSHYTGQIKTMNPFKNTPGKKAKVEQNTPATSTTPITENAATPTKSSPEVFGRNFILKLDQLRNDPQNSKLKQSFIVSSEKSLKDVLKKVYGPQSSAIPEMVAIYNLKSLNEKINLNQLQSGDIVTLPK
jgi:hypothetical protein